MNTKYESRKMKFENKGNSVGSAIRNAVGGTATHIGGTASVAFAFVKGVAKGLKQDPKLPRVIDVQ